MKKDMCESCKFSDIRIVESISKYPFFHKTKVLNKYCHKNARNVKIIVTYEESKHCGYKPKSGKIGKTTTQKTL